MRWLEIERVARLEHAKYPDEAREFHRSIGNLERVGVDAVHSENERGGQARHVVAEVSRVLGVDIDEGPGHRWDPDHMSRVVGVADTVREERDDLREEVALWKALAERQDNTAPLRMELRTVKRERDEVYARLSMVQQLCDQLRERATPDDDVDELKAVIVSQAREIARLKGESE